jgi:hypothetical protein
MAAIFDILDCIMRNTKHHFLRDTVWGFIREKNPRLCCTEYCDILKWMHENNIIILKVHPMVHDYTIEITFKGRWYHHVKYGL